MADNGKSYQKLHFGEIADAIRYVDGTVPPIIALDFADRIRALKSMVPGDKYCKLWDNVPSGCGESHGLRHLDYTLVNCVTEKLRSLPDMAPGVCLCEDNWGYGSPACDGLYGLLHLDYTPVDCTFPYNVLWGYYPDAS